MMRNGVAARTLLKRRRPRWRIGNVAKRIFRSNNGVSCVCRRHSRAAARGGG